MKQMCCPCGSNKTLGNCCKSFIDGTIHASTAEQLMRSRYSAYALKAVEYLMASTHPETRSSHKPDEIQRWATACDWRQLKIIKATKGKQTDETGEVEFVASYLEDNQLQQHHELSVFKKNNGRWFFYNGQQLPPIKTERNAPCPCASNKKYKKCCGQPMS